MADKREIDVTDRNALRSALEPLGPDAAVAFAARAALRVAPLLVQAVRTGDRIEADTMSAARHSALVTTSFAAMAAAWVACTCSTSGADTRRAADGSAALYATFDAAVASAALYAADGAYAAFHAAALYAADAAYAAHPAAAYAAAAAAKQDLAALQDGESAQNFAAKPL